MKQVWLCERCGSVYLSQAVAKTCEDSHDGTSVTVTYVAFDRHSSRPLSLTVEVKRSVPGFANKQIEHLRFVRDDKCE